VSRLQKGWASSFSMSGVTTAESAARADWIGCEPNARISAVLRMRKVDIATPLRLILRKRDLMFACLLQLTSCGRKSVIEERNWQHNIPHIHLSNQSHSVSNRVSTPQHGY
jgi:hypothetical protein